MSDLNNKYQPTVTACRDDKSIIAKMKFLGIWEKMKSLSEVGRTASILHADELFIWHGNPEDSGYTYFQCDFPTELLLLAARAMSDPLIIGGGATKH